MALGAPFHCCRLTHWMPRLAAPTPLGLVLERQSSQAKDGFNCVLCGAHRGGRASRVSFTKTRTPPESALGAGLGNPHLVMYEVLFVTEGSVSQIHGRAQSSSRERACRFWLGGTAR